MLVTIATPWTLARARWSHFTRCPSSPLLVDCVLRQVHALIAARLQAKITRDFDRADALRMELRGLGVEVHPNPNPDRHHPELDHHHHDPNPNPNAHGVARAGG